MKDIKDNIFPRFLMLKNKNEITFLGDKIEQCDRMIGENVIKDPCLRSIKRLIPIQTGIDLLSINIIGQLDTELNSGTLVRTFFLYPKKPESFKINLMRHGENVDYILSFDMEGFEEQCNSSTIVRNIAKNRPEYGQLVCQTLLSIEKTYYKNIKETRLKLSTAKKLQRENIRKKRMLTPIATTPEEVRKVRSKILGARILLRMSEANRRKTTKNKLW